MSFFLNSVIKIRDTLRDASTGILAKFKEHEYWSKSTCLFYFRMRVSEKPGQSIVRLFKNVLGVIVLTKRTVRVCLY